MQSKDKIIYVAIWSLVAVVVAMIGMFIYAILDPNVDDAAVFQIVGPSFQGIVGAMIGIVAGVKIGQSDE